MRTRPSVSRWHSAVSRSCYCGSGPLYVLRFLPTFADALLCGLTVRAAHSRPSNCAVMRLMTSMGFALASGVTFFPRASRPAALRDPAEG